MNLNLQWQLHDTLSFPFFLPSHGFKTKLPQSHTQNRQNHSETLAGFCCWYCVIPVIPLLPLLDPKLSKASCCARPVDGAMAALAEDFDLGFFESNQHPCIRYWWSKFFKLLYKNLDLKIPIYCILDRYNQYVDVYILSHVYAPIGLGGALYSEKALKDLPQRSVWTIDLVGWSLSIEMTTLGSRWPTGKTQPSRNIPNLLGFLLVVSNDINTIPQFSDADSRIRYILPWSVKLFSNFKQHHHITPKVSERFRKRVRNAYSMSSLVISCYFRFFNWFLKFCQIPWMVLQPGF